MYMHLLVKKKIYSKYASALNQKRVTYFMHEDEWSLMSAVHVFKRRLRDAVAFHLLSTESQVAVP